MLDIKIATMSHYFDVYDMVLRFAANSPYTDYQVDESKVADLVLAYLESPGSDRICFVVEHEGRAVGMLAAQTSEILFSRMKIAAETVWWMEPEFRNSTIPFKLLEAYEFWAKRVGCSIAQLSTVETAHAARVQPLYERKGYRLVERGFIKDIN